MLFEMKYFQNKLNNLLPNRRKAIRNFFPPPRDNLLNKSCSNGIQNGHRIFEDRFSVI